MKRLARSRPLQQLGTPAGGSGDPSAAPTPVDRIPHDGVPQVLQMNPDLMGPPGVQLQPEQVDHLEPGNDRGVGPGRPALRGNAHALPVLLAPGDRRLDANRSGVEMAPGQRRVAAMDPARRDGGAEPPVGQIGLGHDHESGGVAVQPMDDARPALRASGQRGAARDQRVDEGVVPMAGGRVNHQAGRLVDDGEVLVLENERERDGGGLERTGWFVVGDLNGYDLAPDQEA